MPSLEQISPMLLSQKQIVDLIEILKEQKQLNKEKKQLSLSCTIDVMPSSSINSVLSQCSSIFNDEHIGTENLCFRFETFPYTKDKKNKNILWRELLETLKVLKFNHPKVDIVVSGFQFLWQVAQKRNEELKDIFLELRNYGVQVIESSPDEFEGVLTNSEILHFHEQAHQCNLPSIAKIELNRSYQNEKLLWEKMLAKLNGYLNLQKKTRGFLGIMLEKAPNTFISNNEYLEACLLVKHLLRKSSCRLISSSRSIPSSQLSHHGVDDLGHFCLLQHKKAFFEQLVKENRDYSCDLYTRDVLFSKSFFNLNEAPFINKFLDGKKDLNSIQNS